MKAIFKMTWMELKLLLRNPIAVGFTIPFPVFLLILFGTIWGNTPQPELGGLGTLDILAPAYLGLIIVTAGLMNLPPALAARREQGILRRFRATPMRPIVVLASQVVVNLILAVIGSLLMIFVARIVYNLRMPVEPLAIALAFLLSGLSFFALSFIIASIARSTDAARSIGMALFFPMMMLSGAAVPRALMPETVQRISEVLPMTQSVILFQNLWFGAGWNIVAVLVLGAMLIAGALISVRTFRWE